MVRRRRGKGRAGGRGALRLALVGAVVVLAVVAGAVLESSGMLGRGGGGGRKARVVIPRGATFRAAADSLAAHRLVGSARLFRLYASLSKRDRAIKPGTYDLARGSSYAALVDALVSGKGLVHIVTIPEGWELRQIAAQLARALGVPDDSVAAAARDTALLHRLDVPTPTLEGYLFPATYTFPDGTTAREAVHAMVARFEAAWKPEWDARLQALALNRHQAVTLASIVEREAKRPEERPVIAAVYYNRLRKGMLLQADPTVQYALPQHTARVLYRDLEVDSPYNTYRNKGLPPGPIGSPGAPSLEAAVAPAQVPYLYFVAHPDGHHEFRTTFAEHEVAVREARRLRAVEGAAPARPGGSGPPRPPASPRGGR
jgi:UPF0755 protein